MQAPSIPSGSNPEGPDHAKDLRSFLDDLEAGPPSDFATITAEVDPNLQLTAIIRKLQAENRHPALFFEQVKGTPIRVVANSLATRDRLGTVFGCSGDDVVRTYMERQDRLIPPIRVLIWGVSMIEGGEFP